MTTQLQKVKEFHDTFNVYSSETPALPETKIRDLRKRLIDEEHEEFKLGEVNNDIVEIADALADLIYVINGTAVSYGIPLDEIFDIVHNSNMDKTCSSEEHAQETVKHYASLPEPVETYYTEKNGRWLVFRKADNKVLKRKGWTAPDFSHLLK